MGSSNSHIHDTYSQISGDESINTLLSDEIYKLTYEQFLNLVGQLNLLSKKCLDSKGSQLSFAVKKDTDSTIFWKATVQIACVKIDENKKISIRLLSLLEFIKVFKTFKCQAMAIEQCKSSGESQEDMTISGILDRVSESSTESQNICCICFERKQEILLPCAHSYCTQCIEEWNESHDTCPICREKLDSTEDSWVLSEVPKAEEINTAITENLLQLTNKDYHPCNPS